MKISDPEFMQQKIRRLEKEIQDLNSKLNAHKVLVKQFQQAQKTKALASLAGGVAHDFNNILQAILGYTQLALMQKDRQENDYQTFCDIEAAVKKGSALTEQFLRIGRQMRPKYLPVNLNAVILETRNLLKRTISKMITIDLKLDDDLAMIHADKGQIEQILMNLIINARDAMADKGCLTLTTRNIVDPEKLPQALQAGASPEHVLLTVEDNGCGMSPKTLRHIFEPFYTHKKDGNGNGLGLSMVSAIVKNHDGYISCSSREGKGTVFRLYFPAVEHMPLVKEIRPPKISSEPRGRETILMVDDEADILNIGREMLQKFGYKVITAHSGEEAVEKYARQTIDSVILDVGMPGMGGINCLKEILNINHRAKVVIISGYTESDQIQEAMNLGAKAFLNKPYRINHLLVTVRKVLDEKDRQLEKLAG